MLGSKFNQFIDKLPRIVTRLILGYCFDQSIDNLFSNLMHLGIGDSCNQPIDNLSNSITYLTFGIYFNQLVENLPINTKELKIVVKVLLCLIKKIAFRCKIVNYANSVLNDG